MNRFHYGTFCFRFLFEVDLQFLLKRILVMADYIHGLERGSSGLHKFADGFTEPFLRTRCLIYYDGNLKTEWYRVLDPASFREAVTKLFDGRPGSSGDEEMSNKLIQDSMKDEKVMEKEDCMAEIDRDVPRCEEMFNRLSLSRRMLTGHDSYLQPRARVIGRVLKSSSSPNLYVLRSWQTE